MRRHPLSKVLKVVTFVTLFIAAFGFVVMELWNWLMPDLFGLHMITYWQGVGILVLTKVLFGGFRGRPGPPWHWRHRMMARWEQMTPEEREKFRQGMESRPAQFGPTGSDK
jgi:hypothetical protein